MIAFIQRQPKKIETICSMSLSPPDKKVSFDHISFESLNLNGGEINGKT